MFLSRFAYDIKVLNNFYFIYIFYNGRYVYYFHFIDAILLITLDQNRKKHPKTDMFISN